MLKVISKHYPGLDYLVTYLTIYLNVEYSLFKYCYNSNYSWMVDFFL